MPQHCGISGLSLPLKNGGKIGRLKVSTVLHYTIIFCLDKARSFGQFSYLKLTAEALLYIQDGK